MKSIKRLPLPFAHSLPADLRRSLLALGATATVCLGVGMPAQAGTGAKDLYYRQIQDATAVSNVGFTYSIELLREGKTAKVDSRFPFRNGDQIRFHVQPNIDGYMYIVLSSGSQGGQALLYPAPGSPESNQVRRGQDYVLPEFGTLAFDDAPGIETVKLIVSKDKLTEAAKSERGIVITPKGQTSGQTKVLLEHAGAPAAASWSSEHPPSFKDEPAATFVTTDTVHPLVVSLQLQHGAPAVIASKPSSERTTPVRPAIKVPAEVASKVVQDKWAFVVGISKFSDPRWNLRYPEKDARDFSQFLVKECNFAQDHVRVLTDEEATRERILTELGTTWLPQNVKENDLVVLYFASHGTSAEQDIARKNFLVAYDTNPISPFATGIEINDLARTIKRRIKAQRVVVVLDTCHSGVAEPGAKALGGATKSFDIQELVQGTGQLIVASASSNQKAHDSLRYKNGIFTKHLMDGIRSQSKFSDAFAYTKTKVAAEALADFKNTQTPVLKDAEWKGESLKLAAPPAQPRPAVDEAQ